MSYDRRLANVEQQVQAKYDSLIAQLGETLRKTTEVLVKEGSPARGRRDAVIGDEAHLPLGLIPTRGK